MSFMLTTEQAMNKTKTVTRRLGWWFLTPGDIVQQVERCQGLKKGETVKKIHLIRVVRVRQETLCRLLGDRRYGRAECIKEGFPDMYPEDFVLMFMKHNRCNMTTPVNRIEFEYINKNFYDDEDMMGDFLAACCFKGDDLAVSLIDLYDRYKSWCDKADKTQRNLKAFSNRVRRQYKTSVNRGITVVFGIGLLEDDQNG
jgi:hypothetical protein